MSLRSEARFISIKNVKSGMMVTFTYTKPNNEVKPYTVLVVDPEKPHATSGTTHMHALIIDDLSDMELITLVARIGDGFTFNPDDRSHPLTNLNTDESYTKYFEGFKSQRRYRTFIPSSISNLRQVLIGELE